MVPNFFMEWFKNKTDMEKIQSTELQLAASWENYLTLKQNQSWIWLHTF